MYSLRSTISQAADLGQYAFLKLLRLYLPSDISRIAVLLNAIFITSRRDSLTVHCPASMRAESGQIFTTGAKKGAQRIL